MRGRIARVSRSRREAGIGFLDLAEYARGRIQEWISLKSSQSTFQDESRTIRPQLHAPPQSYHIREVRFDADWDRVVKNWTECHRQFPGRTLHCDPEWIEQRFKHENVRIFLLEKDDEIVGAVPFVLNREQLVCELGEFALTKLPLRVLFLRGYTPNIPEERPAYDRLIHQILRSDFDAIYMENVKVGSFLWSYLQSSALIRREFRLNTKRRPFPHFLIRLDGTFESYLKRFCAKTRKNRLREIRRLRERGQVNLLRVSQTAEIDAFLETAYEISERNSKFKRRGWDLAARDPDMLRRELQFLAERGWLRSYVLKCDGVPCCFILGHQHGSSFFAETVGVDDAWRSYSVGTVILLLALEDLFKENPPEFYDFGTSVKFQEHFATESYPEARVWLFRRRTYPILASSIYCACDAVSMSTGMLLDRFGLKSRVKQLLWNHR
jgi:CelD/BcsL family acetyltransferase involved in cellulose biosynthesis